MNHLVTVDGHAYELTPSFRCPACDGPLYCRLVGVSSDSNPIDLFCGCPDCESRAADTGASGRDMEEARQKLAENVNDEFLREMAVESRAHDLNDAPSPIQRLIRQSYGEVATRQNGCGN